MGFDPLGQKKTVIMQPVRSKDEDLMHALVLCEHARKFWDEGQGWTDCVLPRLYPRTWAKDITCDSRFSDSD
jgi:hypothetical protein